MQHDENKNSQSHIQLIENILNTTDGAPEIQSPIIGELESCYNPTKISGISIDNILSVQEEIDILKMQRVNRADEWYSNVSSDWDTPPPSIQAQIEPPIIREEAKCLKRHSRSSPWKKHHHKSRHRSRSRNKKQNTLHNERHTSNCDSLSPARKDRIKKRSKHHNRASRSRSRSKSYNRSCRHRSKSRNRYKHHNMVKYHGDSDTERYSSIEEQVSPPLRSRHHRNAIEYKRKDTNKRRVISTSDHRHKKKKNIVSSSDSSDSMSVDEENLVALLAIIRKLNKSIKKGVKTKADKIESNNHLTKKESIKTSTASNITKKEPKSTEEWKDSFDIELADDFKIDETIYKTNETSTTKPVVHDLPVDFQTLKQVIATVEENEKLLAKYEPTLTVQRRDSANHQSAITQSAHSQFVNDPRLQSLRIDANHQSEFARSNYSQFSIDPRLQRMRNDTNQQSAFTQSNYSPSVDPRLKYFRGHAEQGTTSTQASIPYYQLPTQSFPRNVNVDERLHPHESTPSEHGYASLKDMSQHLIESNSSTSTGYHKKFEQVRQQFITYDHVERQKYDNSKIKKNNIHFSNVYGKKAETLITYCGGQASVLPTFSEIAPSNIGNTMSNLHHDICQSGHTSTYGEHRRSRQSVITSTSKNTIPETVTRPSNTESISCNRRVTATGMSNSKINFKVQESAREYDGLTKNDTTNISSSVDKSNLKDSNDSKFRNNFYTKEKAKYGQNMGTICSSTSSRPNAHLGNTPGKNTTSTAKFNFKIPKKSTSKTTEISPVDITDDWSSKDEMDVILRRSESQKNTSTEENSHKSRGDNPGVQMSLNQRTNNSLYDKYKRNMKPICSSTPLISSSQDGNVCSKNLVSTTKEKNGTMELNDVYTTNHYYLKAGGSKSQSKFNINENRESEDMPFVTSSSSSADAQRKSDTIASDTIAKLKELTEPSHFQTSISKDTLSTVKAAIDKLTKETSCQHSSFDLVNKPKAKPRKNELDRLNEDIDASFIRDDVLYATGKRVCSRQQHNYVDNENDASPAKNTSLDDINIEKIKKKNVMLRARSNTTILEPPYKRARQPALQELKSTLPRLETIRTRLPTIVIKFSREGIKRSPHEVSDSKKVKMVAKAIIKNDNPEWHSLKKIMNCFLCNKPPGASLVHHYVNFHPDDEVVISRLAPDVADSLRNSENVKKCTRIKRKGKNYLNQFCHFCNVYKCLGTRQKWINHIAKHTGYYQYECTECAKKFSERCSRHPCGMECLRQIPQPQFQKDRLYAYLCDICNFVRFNKSEIEAHINCQHGSSFEKALFVKVMFLSLPQMTQKKKLAYNGFDFHTESECEESEYDWEFDEDYRKNLELEYQEEQRLELEEEEGLKEYLEKETLESSKENSEDLDKSKENEELDINEENNMIPEDESHTESSKEINKGLDRPVKMNKELDKNEESNMTPEDERHADSSKEIIEDLDKFQENNEEVDKNEENNMTLLDESHAKLSKENNEDIDKLEENNKEESNMISEVESHVESSKEINEDLDKFEEDNKGLDNNEENNVTLVDESHAEVEEEVNEAIDQFEEYNEELGENEENNMVFEDESQSELEDMKTIEEYKVTPCNILPLDTQNEASSQHSTPSSVIVISDDEDDVLIL